MNKSIFHKARFLIIFFIYGLIVIWSWFFLIVSGVLNGKVRGFDLGPDDQIYVGVNKKILIFDHDGNESGKIYLNSLDQFIQDDYCFFIDENRLIIGGSGNYTDSPARVFDLNGQAVSNDSNTYSNKEVIKLTRRKSVEKNGNTLLLDNHHGLKPTKVIFNGKVIYKMKYIEFLLSGIPFAILCALFFIGLSSSLAVFIFDPEVKAYLDSLKSK